MTPPSQVVAISPQGARSCTTRGALSLAPVLQDAFGLLNAAREPGGISSSHPERQTWAALIAQQLHDLVDPLPNIGPVVGDPCGPDFLASDLRDLVVEDVGPIPPADPLLDLSDALAWRCGNGRAARVADRLVRGGGPSIYVFVGQR